MDSLHVELSHKRPEPRDESAPTGFVRVELGEHRGVLLTPSEIDPGREYPLVTVLHGAGRQDEMLVKACRNEPEARQMLFFVPRSLAPTWDLIAGDERPDLDFLGWAWDLIYRRYPVDAGRQALLGYSDGASYALSVGLSNPHLFRAVMGWAAGFLALDARRHAGAEGAADARRPAVLLEYGTHDELFPYERVALPMRDQLVRMGYRVEFRTDQGGRHWPSGDFQPDALDWFQGDPWEPRS